MEIGKYEKYTEYAECAQYGKIYANYAKYAVYADLIKQPTPGSVMPMAMFFPSFGQYLHLNRSLAICFFKFDTGFEHILLLLAYTDMPDTPLTLHTPLPPGMYQAKRKKLKSKKEGHLNLPKTETSKEAGKEAGAREVTG